MWGGIIGGGLSLAGGLMGGSGAPKFPYSISGERNRMNFGQPTAEALGRGGFNLRNPGTFQPGDFMPLSGIQSQREFALGQGQSSINSMQDILARFGPGLMQGWQDSMYQGGAGGMAPGAQDLVKQAQANSAGIEEWLQRATQAASQGGVAAKQAAQGAFDRSVARGSADVAGALNARGLGSSTALGQQVSDTIIPNSMADLMASKAMAELTTAGRVSDANIAGAGIMGQRRGQEESLGLQCLLNDWSRRFDPGREMGYLQTLLGLEQMPGQMQANMFAQPSAMFASPASSAQMAGQGAGTQFVPGTAMGNIGGAMGNVGGNILNQYLSSLFKPQQGGVQSGTPGPNPWPGGPTSSMGKPWWG
jgi:hypothetical protein